MKDFKNHPANVFIPGFYSRNSRINDSGNKIVKSLFMVLFCFFCLLESNAANFVSTSSGDWEKGATWGNSGNNVQGSGYPGPSDNATITSGITVQVKQNGDGVNNMTINSGAVLSNSNNKDLAVSGNYVLNGTHTGGNGSTVTFSGSGASISGIGTIDRSSGWY